jgi:hypothetical protein
MEGTAQRKARWIDLFVVFLTARKPQKAKNNVLAEIPPQGISMNAIRSAETVLQAIPVRGAREGIGAFLSVIKGIHFVSFMIWFINIVRASPLTVFDEPLYLLQS